MFATYIYSFQSLTGRKRIDFKDQKALRILTQCLLHKDFDLIVNFPENKLVPTLPLRLNYILWLEDILRTFQFKENIRGIDIGCGASCIYGLLSAKQNKWEMYGTEVDLDSLRFARENVTKNRLEGLIHVIEQKEKDELFKVVLYISEEIHFSMCNPPFYDDFEETPVNRTGGRDMPRSSNTGTGKEIRVEGSEVSFVIRMIDESLVLKDRIKIYTSMLGKKSSLASVKNYLKEKGVTNFITTEFCQGRTTRWGIAWSHVSGIYLNKVPQYERKNMRKPTGHSVSFTLLKEGLSLDWDRIEKMLEKLFSDLKMRIGLHEQEDEKSVWEVSALTNTWSHQRRKRRRAEKGDDGPPEKMTDVVVAKDESLVKEQETSLEPFLVIGVCLKQISNDFHLELGYLEGTAGKDGANQVLQYIKNNYKKYI